MSRALAREVASTAALALGVSAAASLGLPAPSAAEASSHAARSGARELLVVDARVAHAERLLAAARPGVEPLLLEADVDGLAQIEAALRGRDFAAVHLVGHGRPGAVELGATVLDAPSAAANQERLARWFAARAPGEPRAEVLVYGCDSAAGAEGASFLRALADATAAEVAGSIDRTGGVAGADWVLEASIGAIDATLPIAYATARAYPATLEVFQVTTNAPSGAGSLAQAVADANANGNPGEADVIQFGSLSGAIALDATLSVTEPLTIAGAGASRLTIDAGGAARIFDVTAPLEVSNLTLANGAGDADGGGAFRVVGTSLSLERCVLVGSEASGNGGAIAAVDSTLLVEGAAFEDNVAALGGAIFVSGSALDVVASSFEENAASEDGGALAIDSSTVFIDDSLFAGNEAGGAGGAIYAGHDGGGPPLVSVQNSTLSGNRAEAGGGMAVAGNADAELVHATVTANAITGTGGGSCIGAGVDGCALSNAGIVVVESSILAGNLEGSAASVDLGADPLDLELEVRSSLIGLLEGGVATSGEPIFGEDPLLGPLADNGGPTRTHALLEGSPAIDEGENPSALAHDQRGAGFPRVIGAAADMGAYEWSPNDGTGGGGGDGDGGVEGDGGAPIPKGPGGDDGCGCSVPGAPADGLPTTGGAVAALLGLLALGRRRRARR